MWRRREGPQVPLRRSRYWLASETFLLDRGLEEVSFPNSLTLFLVIIGSQVKPWTEASCIGFPPSVAFKVRVSTVGKKKKNPYFPCFLGQRRNLRCCGEGWPCPRNVLAVITRSFVVQVHLLFLPITSRKVNHTWFSVSVTSSHLF